MLGLGLVLAVVLGWAVPRLVREGPAQVGAGTLPIPRGAIRSATYRNCSPQTAVAYLPNFPCDTYVLIAPVAIGAEERLLAARGWSRAHRSWRNSDYSVCASFLAGRTATVADVNARGFTTKAKTHFVRALRQAGTSEPALYAVLYPASFEGAKRC